MICNARLDVSNVHALWVLLQNRNHRFNNFLLGRVLFKILHTDNIEARGTTGNLPLKASLRSEKVVRFLLYTYPLSL